MKILFCGDVVGRAGREVVLQEIPKLREEHALDLVIVNGENAAHGFGISSDICEQFFKAGVDVITTGDHVWDQQEIISYISQNSRVIRPANFPEKTPGKGYTLVEMADGSKVLVIQLLGQVFHKEYLNSPFEKVEEILKQYALGRGDVKAIVVDMHAEATSEKNAMGQYLDGRVSMVVGSHTHVPTADARILKQGTAYQTDTGMCGDYDSVIGFEKEGPLARFTTKMHKTRMQPAKGEGTLCGVIVETNDKGLAQKIEIINAGYALKKVV